MADYGIRRYRLGTALLERAWREGFSLLPGGILQTEGHGRHSVILPGLNSARPDCAWGRLSLRCRLGEESLLSVRAFALDQDSVIRGGQVVQIDTFLLDPAVPREEKERLFLMAGGMERSGAADVLLDGQQGRWLWLWLEINGPQGSLEDMRVYVPGDNFFRTFPQVYQADNEFLRRYLSIFSTMYQDFQEQIDALPQLLDVDTAPEALLPMFASWLGLETDETLFTPQELRRLLKAAPGLLERKGTREAVEEVVRLFVEEPVYIVEQNLLPAGQRHGGELYGTTPYDFTVMLGRELDEKLRLRLKFLIDQFKPIRSRCHIVFLEECGGLDAFTYLDMNARVLQNAPGSLDDGKALTGMTFLE